ncbi:MAG: hypothetical protein KIT84_19595 [Labilithrix sp.]|nr:hypothetical protein [Labilithrix sp.]MCW5813241.1 hypothetical protein [Labilithrix sp.]
MLAKSILLVAAASAAALLACARGGGNDENGNVVDSSYTFAPAGATRTCAGDADCVVVVAVRECSQCCGYGAIARGEAERAHAAVLEACTQPGAPMGGICGMACAPQRAACFEGTCVMLPEHDAGGLVCPNAADGGAGAAPDPGPGPSCGARAVQTGFEDGLDPSWTATDPSAFQIDRAEPLAGGASLRIAYRQKNDYLTIAQPDACAIRVAFTLRTRLLASGLTIARIVTGAGSWLHLRLESCGLSVIEETRSDAATGLGVGDVVWPVPEDAPVRVVLTVDLRTKTLTTVAAPLGSAFPAPRTQGLAGDPSGTSAIRAIEIGSAPGIVPSTVGTVWLDDVAID